MLIEKIIDYSTKNLFIVFIICVVLIILSIFSFKNISLDAIPDLSPPQVIVEIKWKGQSPNIIEEQISYPLVESLLSLPGISTVRSVSSFENALVYIIFKDGIDIYDARTRVLEQLSTISSNLPKDAYISLGPDSTGIGWIYQYALVSKNKTISELRSLQDYYYRYALMSIDGVSDVASVGGLIKSYEITINQELLLKYNLTIKDLILKISKSNNDVGGNIFIENGFEHVIKAKGYLKTLKDIENIAIKYIDGSILKISDIADVKLTSLTRRGMADLNGQGEVVGGILISRYGENPYDIIKKVKDKLNELKTQEIDIVEVYDRSKLIDESISTLRNTLFYESLLVILIILIFLLHFRSSLVVIITLPLTILFTFFLMKIFDIDSNIMSLGGIAIAIGAMIDATIVMVENAHKEISNFIQKDGEITNKRRVLIIINSCKKLGHPIFFALILVIVAFLPIFFLEDQEGKLFKPLAFTKTFAMLCGALISITVVPLLMIFLIKGKIIPENKNIISRFFIFLYSPLLKFSLRFRYFILLIFFISFYLILDVYKKQKWEFMPMIDEQTIMYMPVTNYGISIDLAKELTQKTNIVLKSFPEVKTVFAKVGRSNSATDPAPLAMIETIIELKPKSQWRKGITKDQLLKQMDKKLQLEGLINSWTYPIRGRIDMLLTGIRTPLGIKLYGKDRKKLQEYSLLIEQKLKSLNETLSVSSDKINSGYYLNIDIDDKKLAYFGITKENILETVKYSISGSKISTIIDGFERYPIQIRLKSQQRNDIISMKKILIKTNQGYHPLGHFANIYYEEGPSVIKSEKGVNVSFIYITPKNLVSIVAYEKKANELLNDLQLPLGFYYEWDGHSKYLQNAMTKLNYIIPLTFLIIFLLIYLALRNFLYTLIIFFTLPFALLGGVWYLDFMNFNFSIAVIVGFMALLGVAAETSIVMILYLDEALKKLKQKNKSFSKNDLIEAIYSGAVLRLRPKLMTIFAIILGLIPIMFNDGVGNEVMKRIAAPMIGGMISSSILTLIIIPTILYIIFLNKKEII
jgi:copper/silver efflux system protein